MSIASKIDAANIAHGVVVPSKRVNNATSHAVVLANTTV